MRPAQILGIVLVVVGIVLLGIGYNATQAPAEELSEAFTGRYSRETTWYFILGAAAVVGGGLLAFFGRRR